MDPNRNKLETILKLPTHRLLEVYRKEREYLHVYASDWVWYCDCSSCVRWRENRKQIRQRVSTIKEELDKREHLSK
jgi:hypothetical protein